MADLNQIPPLSADALARAVSQLTTGAAEFEEAALAVRRQDSDRWSGDSYDKFVLGRDDIVAKVKALAMLRRSLAAELSRLGPAWSALCQTWSSAGSAYTSATLMPTLPTGVTVSLSSPKPPQPGTGALLASIPWRRKVTQIRVDVWRTPQGIDLKNRLTAQGLDYHVAWVAAAKVEASYKAFVSKTFTTQESTAHQTFVLACNSATEQYQFLANEVARNIDSLGTMVPNMAVAKESQKYRGKTAKELASDDELAQRLKDDREFAEAFVSMLGPKRAAEYFDALADPTHADSFAPGDSASSARAVVIDVINDTWPARQIDSFARSLPVADLFEYIAGEGSLDTPAGMAIATQLLVESGSGSSPASMRSPDPMLLSEERLVVAVQAVHDRLVALGWSPQQFTFASSVNPQAAMVALIKEGIDDSPELARYIMVRHPEFSVPGDHREGTVGPSDAPCPIAWNQVAEALMKSSFDGTLDERNQMRAMHIAEIQRLMDENPDFAQDISDEWATTLAKSFVALIESTSEHAALPNNLTEAPSTVLDLSDYLADLLVHDGAAIHIFSKVPIVLGRYAVDHINRGGSVDDWYMSTLDLIDDMMESEMLAGRLTELEKSYDVDYSDFVLSCFTFGAGAVPVLGTAVSIGEFIWSTGETLDDISKSNPSMDKLRDLPEFKAFNAEMNNDELILETIVQEMSAVTGIPREDLYKDQKYADLIRILHSRVSGDYGSMHT